MSHPAIADAAVIGIPDDAAGELPRAYVIIKPNAKCNEADIHAFTKGNEYCEARCYTYVYKMPTLSANM